MEMVEEEEEWCVSFLCLHLLFLSSLPSPAFSLSSCRAALLLSSVRRLSRRRDLKFSVSYQVVNQNNVSKLLNHLHPVENQVIGLAQTFQEVVELFPLHAAIVVVALAEPKVDLGERKKVL